MLRWLRSIGPKPASAARAIPDHLWNATLVQLPFLQTAGVDDLAELRHLVIDDGIRLTIAAQACLPVLHLREPWRGIDWYDDFVGIVVYPGAVRARRETMDENGVVHQYEEVLTGEAMQDGPVTLSWPWSMASSRVEVLPTAGF